MAESGFSPAKAALLGAAFLFAAAGCASVGTADSRETAVSRAAAMGFARQEIAAGPFRLAAFTRRPVAGSETLSVYIEGDGAPWVTPWHPPRDPTPVKPVALSLAAADPAPAVVYLGRPCQYLDEAALSQCDGAWWMERRFAPEVVAAYDEAVARLKSDFGARRIRLFGHSGGGVVAALVAFRRMDVERLVTVAAPLALTEWTAWHDIAPLAGSLDPAGQTGSLPPGVHWAGGRDGVVPPAVVERFVKAKGGRMAVAPDYDHECCWARDWARLLEESK